MKISIALLLSLTSWMRKDRYLLTSRFVEGKSYSSLSEDLGIQPDSVRMAVTRAKRKAAAILKRKYLTR